MTQAEFAGRVVAMQDTLYRISCTILPQLCDREDAVQSAIEKALRKRMLLRKDDALEAWLTRILINECKTMLKKRKRMLSFAQVPDIQLQLPPDADREWAEVLLHLPEKYRLPLVLYVLEGYSLAEVAQIIHLPVNTVKTRISRARKQMRQEVMDNAE